MVFIDYYAHASNYNKKIGYEAYPMTKMTGVWAIFCLIVYFCGILVNAASMKLYHNMAYRKSTLVLDRYSASYASILKLCYIVTYFAFSIIGTIIVRKANI
jgi:hypothetical protein